MNKTVTNLHDESERVNLPEPHWEGDVDVNVGYEVEALYSGPRTGRKFAQVYNRWENPRTHCSHGREWVELEESQYLKYCSEVDCEPTHVEAIAG